MSADMDLHARKTAEARLHEADYMDGEPLDIGDGYSVAFHSPNCRYCAIKATPGGILEISAEQLRKLTH